MGAKGDRGRPPVATDDHHLIERTMTFDEGRFAVGEVEAPEPAEPIVETEFMHGGPAGLELLPPAAEGFGVVGRQVLDVEQLHPGGLRDRARQHLDRRQAVVPIGPEN